MLKKTHLFGSLFFVAITALAPKAFSQDSNLESSDQIEESNPNRRANASPSGSLPIMYINVYTDETKVEFNDEIIDKDLNHKNYFNDAEYWLDLNGCDVFEGAESVGSESKPLALQIKARGNFTRTYFSKKPFKLKLDKKQSLMGLTKSKHFALLAAADDKMGYLRNITGFNLGKRIGLPWTPTQIPIEVVINGDYRGIYLLTESIRVDEDRINITELDDNVDVPNEISGGYIVELDNYDDTNQIVFTEKTCVTGYIKTPLKVTWDSPEEYSELQKRFITDQFTVMNDAVGVADKSDEIWEYIDLDDAVRYYLVMEILSHYEAYHGSTYMFRDRGESEKWHFSPIWDCGHAFDGPTDDFFYNYSKSYGNNWIPSLRVNKTFNEKLYQTWEWFMKEKYPGIEDDLRAFAETVKGAVQADYNRWVDTPLPSDPTWPSAVADNRDMDAKLTQVINNLNAKIEWLKSQFGDFTMADNVEEPERDATPAAPLPDYASIKAQYYNLYFSDLSSTPWDLVYAYAADSESEEALLGEWPGTSMDIIEESETDIVSVQSDKTDRKWSITFIASSEIADSHYVIFHNNIEQTEKYYIIHDNIYYRNDISNINLISVDNFDSSSIYSLQGVLLKKSANQADINRLSPGLYIIGDKKVYIK